MSVDTEKVPAEEFARRYGWRKSAVIHRIRAGIYDGVKEDGKWYVIRRGAERAGSVSNGSVLPTGVAPAPAALPDGSIPLLYRVSRILALVVCVPAALALIVGVTIPAGGEVATMIVEREERLFTTGRGYRGVSYLLHTEAGDVEVSAAMFQEAREGDTLLVQRGLFKFGVQHFDQRARLVREGRTIREERPSDFFVLAMVLYVLAPLLSFRPYEKWKHATQLKVLFVMIPPSVLIVFLFTL